MARGVKSNLRPTPPPPDTLGPSSQRPVAAKLRKWLPPWPEGLPAARLPLRSLSCSMPTPPRGRISQALGKIVSRNAELRRIIQPEAVFGAKRLGSGMLQTLYSGRRTGGWGGRLEDEGPLSRKQPPADPSGILRPWALPVLGAWCVQPPELYGGQERATLSPAVRGRGLPAPLPTAGGAVSRPLPPAEARRSQGPLAAARPV